MANGKTYTGPAILSAGFRPFFLLASGFATLAVAVWLAIWKGFITLSSVFSPVDWHVHEMIFGYGAAVVAGFLFTAVPNWTGRLPTRGMPLAGLALVWLAGRLASAGLLPLGPVGVLGVDQAFLLLVGAMIAREIVAGRNWRNLKVLVPVTLFWAANIAYHVEAMTTGSASSGHRIGIAILIFLIMLIGGRIIPSFTRNWLVKQGVTRLPVPFDRFDGFAILTAVIALAFWVLQIEGPIATILLGFAGFVQLARLSRWRGERTLRSPLLFMLHVAYGFIPVGFLSAALSAAGGVSAAATLHLFGAGAVGAMTVAVMVRATLGHTGRDLIAGPVATGAFVALTLATLLRVIAEVDGVNRDVFVESAGILWVCAFAFVAGKICLAVTSDKPRRKRPSSAAGHGDQGR